MPDTWSLTPDDEGRGMPDFERVPLHEMTRELAATARGDLPATLVIRGGTLVSVTSGEILPNMSVAVQGSRVAYVGSDASHTLGGETRIDRKSTRLNSSHANISYAVFCLKKKNYQNLSSTSVSSIDIYSTKQKSITSYSIVTCHHNTSDLVHTSLFLSLPDSHPISPPLPH